MSISNINTLADFALLAQASYAFTTSPNDLKLKLQDDASFTATQADYFASRYEFITKQANQSDGFSATIFQDKQSGRYIFSVRGTELDKGGITGAADILADLFIATSGYSRLQATSMYRYWKQLTTVGGAAVSYSENEILQLFAISNGIGGLLTINISAAEYQSFRTSVLADKGIVASQATGTALISPSAVVDVAGHSLGGHLAMLFSRFFPANTGEVVTLNAPGFFPGSTLLSAIGIAPFNASKITRIEADGDGISELGAPGFWPGTKIAIAQENNSGVVAAFSSNHSSVNGNDALALMRVIATLDPTLANNAAALSDLVRKGANTPGDSYENVLDGLRKMLLGASITLTPKTTGTDPVAREQYYLNLKTLQADPKFIALQGQVKIVAPPTSTTQARTDFGAFLSLVYLTPFALTASGASIEATLKSANSTLGNQWDADNALTADQIKEGRANFSDLYLADRAAMLSWLNKTYTEDTDVGRVYDGSAWYFKDEASSKQVWVGNPYDVKSNPLLRKVLFGQSGTDILTGSGSGDHMYGGLGYDTLSGGDGGDYIEGNDGNDTLNGEAGRDILIGGADNDTLDGGLGNDRLEGGLGIDTYLIRATDGNDTLKDLDGIGSIQVEIDGALATLSGGKKDAIVQGRWSTNDGKVSYTFLPGINGIGTLVINWGTQILTVQNYQLGQLGLSMTDKAPVAPPVYSNVKFIAGEKQLTPFEWNAGGTWQIVGSTGNDVFRESIYSDSFLMEGGGGYDRLGGGLGNDRIYAESIIDVASAITAAEQSATAPFVDTLEGWDGDDLLVGGVANYLYGGAGADTLIGGGGPDLVGGDGSTSGFGFDYANTQWRIHLQYDPQKYKHVFYMSSTTSGITENYTHFVGTHPDGKADIIFTGAGDDIADGQLGDDYLSLGAGNDWGFGMQGADTLFGGSGKDILFGDFNWDEFGLKPTADQRINYAGLDGQYHGMDVIDGGADDDYIEGNGLADTLYGGDGNDVLLGDDEITPGRYHGNDYLDGGMGNDRLFGNGGTDEIFGGAGDDELIGDDSVTPGQYHGNDYLDGEAGADKLWGGGGDDELFGGDGNDSLFGDTAVALLATQYHGKDYLDGEDGDDYLVGGAKDDQLEGGKGNDSLYGDGADIPDPDAGNDYLNGAEGADYLDGGAGDDLLLGGVGTDTLQGGAGNDMLIGGAGQDYLSGGEGNDVYLLEAGFGSDTINNLNTNTMDIDELRFGAGLDAATATVLRSNDQLLISFATGDQVQNNNYFNNDAFGNFTLDKITFNDGTQWSPEYIKTKALMSTEGDDLLIGYATADTLTGLGGNDRLYGRAGNDLLVGGAGQDTLDGEEGDDTLDGGLGNDILSGGAGNDVYVFDRGYGTDQIYANNESGLDVVQIAPGIRPDEVRLTRNGDTLNISIAGGDLLLQNFFSADPSYVFSGIRFAGNGTFWDIAAIKSIINRVTNGDDVLFGFGSADTFDGQAGNDYIDGMGGNDTLIGGAGNDNLLGSSGDDVLDGGAGSDALYGGTGNDTFQFARGMGHDSVYEYAASGTDTIRLAADILPSQVTLYRHGNDLALVVDNSSTQLWVSKYFQNPADPLIERISFNDTVIWQTADINSRVISGTQNAMTGTSGNDVFQVDHVSDSITEGANQGTDTVQSWATYVLPSNVENLTLTGVLNTNATGNALDNVLRGNSGNNFLDGGGYWTQTPDGTDTLIGGGVMTPTTCRAGRGMWPKSWQEKAMIRSSQI